MDMASFIALLFAKNMALLPLGEPKIGTENELAPRARKMNFTIFDLQKPLFCNLIKSPHPHIFIQE